ncbi:hypothetical protein OG21DRAFT_1525677 [Imleria badia]|nr:hypothetical protein OG21DRAFT_1525677 [Imleria badia]
MSQLAREMELNGDGQDFNMAHPFGRAHRNDYKTCWCSASCYKMLSKHACNHHYQNADPTAMLPSASERSSFPGSSGGTGDEEGPDESEPTAQDLGCNEEDDGGSNHEVTEEEPDCFSDINPLHFHEETDFELYLLPTDVQAQLEAWLGPALQKELHSITNQVITDKDRDDICTFKLKIISNMPRRVYDQF